MTHLFLKKREEKKKIVGKGNQTVIENITIAYNNVKETKSVLPF